MQVWNVLHAARWKYRMQKWCKKSPSAHHRTTLSGYIFAIRACIDNRKNLLSSSISPTCPYNMVNFGPLATEIVSLVWGTSANFSGFRILAALLHGTLLVGVSQTAALNRGHNLYLAGRPSRWALAHFSSIQYEAHAHGPRSTEFTVNVSELLSLLLWPPHGIEQAIVFLPCGYGCPM